MYFCLLDDSNDENEPQSSKRKSVEFIENISMPKEVEEELPKKKTKTSSSNKKQSIWDSWASTSSHYFNLTQNPSYPFKTLMT